MAQVLIITPGFVKETSVLFYNMDDGYITPIIEQSQESVVQQLLGSEQYDQFLSDIEAYVDSATAIPTNLSNIKNYLEQILVFEVLSRLARQSTMKLTNQGGVTKSGDNNTALTSAEIARMKAEFRNKCDHWRRRLWHYLCENESSYPLWQSPSSDALICPKKPIPRIGGIL